jgi:hypothetical protein
MTKFQLINKVRLPTSIRVSILLIGISVGIGFATGTGRLAAVFTLAKHERAGHAIQVGALGAEGLLFLYAVVAFVLALLIHFGREWPRYVYAIFMAVTVAPVAILFVSGLPFQPLLYVSTSVISAIMLFVPQSNLFYKARKHDRVS